jgi:hypothetical protein
MGVKMTNPDSPTTRWKLDFTGPAKVWSNAPFPSKRSLDKAREAILAFAYTLPDDATISDLIVELEQMQ